MQKIFSSFSILLIALFWGLQLQAASSFPQTEKGSNSRTVLGDIAKDELGLFLAKVATQRLPEGQHIKIYIGMGYTDLIAKLPGGKVVKLRYGPYELGEKQKALESSIYRETRAVIVRIKTDSGWITLDSDLGLFSAFPAYAIYLARDLLTPQLIRKITTYALHGRSYHLDFNKMRQIQSTSGNSVGVIEFFTQQN